MAAYIPKTFFSEEVLHGGSLIIAFTPPIKGAILTQILVVNDGPLAATVNVSRGVAPSGAIAILRDTEVPADSTLLMELTLPLELPLNQLLVSCTASDLDVTFSGLLVN